jgi:hypothetical protein
MLFGEKDKRRKERTVFGFTRGERKRKGVKVAPKGVIKGIMRDGINFKQHTDCSKEGRREL